jgi:hypothetical protein
MASGTAEISQLWGDLMKADILDRKLHLIDAKNEGNLVYETAK